MTAPTQYTCKTCRAVKPITGFYCGGGRKSPDSTCKACRIKANADLRRIKSRPRAALWAAKRQANIEAQHPRVHPAIRAWFARPAL